MPTTLLLCVSKNSVCQKILLRPKWLTLLLQMSVLSSPTCQQHAILLLSDLLCSIDAQELELDRTEMAELPAEFLACAAPADSQADNVVSILLTLIGRMMLAVGHVPIVSSEGSDFI